MNEVEELTNEELVIELSESLSPVSEIALLLEMPQYKIRKIIREHKRRVAEEWEAYEESRVHHEDWRDYGEGVSVRWFGCYRLCVLGSSRDGYRWSIGSPAKRIFNCSTPRFPSRKEAMDDAERVAAGYTR